MNLGTHPWISQVAVAAPDDLLNRVRARFLRPYDEGPAIDDRSGEEPEDVLVEIARANTPFRQHLEDALIAYLNSERSRPTRDEAPVLRGMFAIAGRLSLRIFGPLRAWFERHSPLLQRDSDPQQLGWSALGALAMSQAPGLEDGRDFWLRLWKTVPAPWQPRAFIGLRRHDPEAALAQLGLLLSRATAQQPGADALVVGLWDSPASHEAFKVWLAQSSSKDVGVIVEILRRLRPEDPDVPAPEKK
jgi:hypothetical protein